MGAGPVPSWPRSSWPRSRRRRIDPTAAQSRIPMNAEVERPAEPPRGSRDGDFQIDGYAEPASHVQVIAAAVPDSVGCLRAWAGRHETRNVNRVARTIPGRIVRPGCHR